MQSTWEKPKELEEAEKAAEGMHCYYYYYQGQGGSIYVIWYPLS